MKLFRFFLAMILLGLLTHAGPAQNSGYVHAKARYAFDGIGEPTNKERKEMTLDSYDLFGDAVTWQSELIGFTEVQQYAVSGARLKLLPADKKKVIEQLAKVFVDTYKTAHADPLTGPFVDGGLTGTEVRASVNGKSAITRLFFSGTRLYILTATRPGGFASTMAALKNFRILPKNEYVAALLAEHASRSLPQAPSVEKQTTDAFDNGLKGKVRSVMIDRQDLPKGKLERESEEYYDASGRLVREVSYIDGYPIDITLWGWIDGKRVVDYVTFEYGLDEGPNEQRTKYLIAASGPTTEATVSKRDERYASSFVYTYKNGELSEYTMYHNDGSLNQRRVFVNKANSREEILYDEKGELNYRTVDVLDKSGNVVEHRAYDYRGRLEGTDVYTYEYDRNGNWIVRNEFKKTSGRVSRSAVSVTYRKIEYYEVLSLSADKLIPLNPKSPRHLDELFGVIDSNARP